MSVGGDSSCCHFKVKKINRKNSQKKIFEAFFSFFCLKCSAVVVAAAVVVVVAAAVTAA